jgi:phenylacetate-coenzyme A ligase PaaK-like adenylate-forming protein
MSAENTLNALRQKIFSVTAENFEAVALQVFRFQYENNPVYRQYVDLLKRNVESIQHIQQIPFLPVSFFKTHKVVAASTVEKVFESSGTTGQITSKHYIHSLAIYEESFEKGFQNFFGKANQYCILGLLPSYLERDNSSLVYMVNSLIEKSGHSQSGFFLNEYDKLNYLIQQLESNRQPYLLFGVNFALLQFAEVFQGAVTCGNIIETGGMKGRGKELIRTELHEILKVKFKTENISSEYGMTELLSQAWFNSQQKFESPAWLKVLVRDVYNPFNFLPAGHTGGINVIDLANIYSCSFIETADLGRVYADGTFEVLGRTDHSEIRGCNLLVV